MNRVDLLAKGKYLYYPLKYSTVVEPFSRHGRTRDTRTANAPVILSIIDNTGVLPFRLAVPYPSKRRNMMPGIATQFEILRLTVGDLAGDPDPALRAIATVIDSHGPYAHLGVLGPALADFLPSDPAVADENGEFPGSYPLLWRRLFHVAGRQSLPGLYQSLAQVYELLGTLETIAQNQDCDALKALRDDGFEDRLNQATADFANTIEATIGEATEIAGIIGEDLRPAVSSAGPGVTAAGPTEWTMREFLSWRKPGQWVKALFDVADQENDERLLAYAYGYLIGYAANVCGSGFINSIVGGPSRTQWWRQRFVKNYIDAWVYGYYNQTPTPTFAGDVPTPGYASGAWPNLCSANLHQRVQLAEHDPAELMDLVARNQPLPSLEDAGFNQFSQHWFAALVRTYGTALPAGVDASALTSAYYFTWLVTWFQTSGALLGCDEPEPPEPPDGCGESPTELDPFINGVPLGGGPPGPPPAEVDDAIDETAKICGIILAILGGLALFGGSAVAGAAAIGSAVALLDCNSVVDWQKVRCLLYWQRMYLYHARKGVHRLLVISGLDYPYARELALDEDYGDLFAQFGLEPWETGKNMTKSKPDQRFPGKPWDGTLLTFNRRPDSFENPRSIAYLTEAYPNFFVTDAPLASSDMRTVDPLTTAADGGLLKGHVQFGSAVANARDLLSHLQDGFPDWNLDADRGLGYVAWQFINDYDPDNVRIQPAP